MSMQPDSGFTSSHDFLIQDQFSRQAELFARSPELHGDAQVMLLVDAARAKPADELLDVACGPGTVVAAFAARVRRAVGLDATGAMLDQDGCRGEISASGGLALVCALETDQSHRLRYPRLTSFPRLAPSRHKSGSTGSHAAIRPE